MTDANDHSRVVVDYDPDLDVYNATFDSTETSASTAVVESIASVRRCDPMDLDPVYHSVDTDALDAIVASSDSSRVTVSFATNGVGVTVGADGTVTIQPPNVDEA